MSMRWFYGWNVLAFGLLFQALSFGLVFYSFAIMLVPFQESFAVTLSEVMIASMALQLGVGVYSGLLGKVIDTCPPQYFVAGGGLCLAAGFALVALAPHYRVMVAVHATLFPIGLVLAGTLAAQSLAVKWFRQRRRLAIGLSALGTAIGGFVCPPLVSHLVASHSWQQTYLLLALLCILAICPLALVLLRRRPDAAAAETAATAPEQPWRVGQVLRSSAFWLIVIGFGPVSATFTAIQLNIAAYARDLGIGATQAAYVISLIAVGMIGGKLFFAARADRLGHKVLYTLVCGGHILVIFGLMAASHFHHIMAIALLFGCFVGGVLPLMGAMVVDYFGVQSFGRVMGLVTPFVTVSSALGPLLAASIRDSTGSYGSAFNAFLYVLVPALACLLLLLKKRAAPAAV